MCLLRLPEKEKRYQSGPTYWKTNFSLSSRKENLSPQEFALRAEQRLETAPGSPWNCTAMLSQIREELNTPTDNEQLLRLKRMSKSPHSNPLLSDLAICENLKSRVKASRSVNELGQAWQNIAGKSHIHGHKENRLKLFKSRRHFGEIKQPKTLNQPQWRALQF